MLLLSVQCRINPSTVMLDMSESCQKSQKQDVAMSRIPASRKRRRASCPEIFRAYRLCVAARTEHISHQFQIQVEERRSSRVVYNPIRCQDDYLSRFPCSPDISPCEERLGAEVIPDGIPLLRNRVQPGPLYCRQSTLTQKSGWSRKP